MEEPSAFGPSGVETPRPIVERSARSANMSAAGPNDLVIHTRSERHGLETDY